VAAAGAGGWGATTIADAGITGTTWLVPPTETSTGVTGT
jgi:hypothetical protein